MQHVVSTAAFCAQCRRQRIKFESRVRANSCENAMSFLGTPALPYSSSTHDRSDDSRSTTHMNMQLIRITAPSCLSRTKSDRISMLALET